MARIEDTAAYQRKEVNTSSVTGVSKEADRRLALSPVKAPRPSSVRGVGSTQHAFNQLLKKGGDILYAVSEKNQKKAYLDGEMKYMQGKTLAELEDSGADKNTIAGFKAMQATSIADKWYSEELINIDKENKELTPDEYRNTLNQTFDNLLTDDTGQNELITSIAKERMTKLVRQQMGAHASYKENATFNSYTDMLVSRAESGDNLDAVLDMTDDNALISGLSEDRRRQAVTNAIKLTLAEDNTSIHDSIDASLEGFSAAQKSAIKQAYAQYEVRSQQKFNAELESKVRDVRIKVESGELTYEEAVDVMATYKEEYGQSDKFMFAAESIMERAADRYDPNTTEFSPEERSDVRNLRHKLATGELTFEEGMQHAQMLKEKYGKDDKWLSTVTTRLEGAADAYWSHQQSVLRKAANDAQVQRQFIQNVESKIDSGRIWELDGKGQRAAWKIVDSRLAAEAQSKVANGELTEEQANEYVINKRLSFMSRSGVVDEATAQQWTSLFSYNVLGDDGKVSPAAVAALEQYKRLEDMNPVMADKYLMNQDAKDTFELASTLMEASTDPSNALAMAQATMSKDVRQEDIQKVMSSPDLKVHVDQAVTAAVDNFDPSIISNILGTESGFHEVWDEGIERAMRSTEARADITRLAEANLIRNPFLSPEIAVKEATKDYLAKSTYIMGSMVKTSGSTTMREDMGITANEPMVENAAMLLFLKDNGKRMFGEEFGDWTFFDDRGFSEVHLLSPSTWLNWEAEPIGNIKRAIREVPEMAINYDSATKTFLVAPLSDSGVPGLIRKVPAKMVGAYYMQKRKDAILKGNEKYLQSQDPRNNELVY